jgi:cold shock CspA family protein
MPDPLDQRRPRRGTVTAFDTDRGLGTVTDTQSVALDFHCTAIADGSRDIAVGTEVEFVVRPGHRGRLEAHWLTPVG